MADWNIVIDELAADRNAAIDQSPVEEEDEGELYEPQGVSSDSTVDLAQARNAATVSRRASISNFSISNFSISNQSVSTYITAKSVRSSIDTFRTAWSGSQNVYEKPQIPRSSWYKLLADKKLIPDPLDEKDWSGRGEHAEFKPNERFRINDLLAVEDTLGTSATALVESVRCRRILLARKTIRCNRRMKRADALEEVKHLKRLEHSHIVRVVGTYTFKQDLAILLYPAAEYNLDSFMESILTESPDGPGDEKTAPKLHALVTFFGCLARTLDFLHRNATKHMDIKPKNLLVTQKRDSNAPLSETAYKIYIADFGITRSYDDISEAETDSPTSFTRMYAAPEVDRKRGLPADIFSLGCVYVEMIAHLASRGRKSKRQDLMAILQSNEDQPWRSYAGNISTVTLWLHEVIELNKSNIHFLQLYPIPNMIIEMIDHDPERRPFAGHIASHFGLSSSCCGAGPDDFALEKPSPELAFSERTPHSISSPRSTTTTYQQPLREIPRPIPTILQAAFTRRSQPVFSLYNECVSLQIHFSADATFRQWMMEDSEVLHRLHGRIDAIILIWHFLQRGLPLLRLFNIDISPPDLQAMVKHMDLREKQAKAAVELFLDVCVQQLRMESETCFEMIDLFGDDLVRFMKVIKFVNRVLFLLGPTGKGNPFLQLDDNDLHSRLAIALAGPRTNRGYLSMSLIPDFLESERLYVKDLETLEAIRLAAIKHGLLSTEDLDSVFSNLIPLLDFHHESLKDMESSCSLPTLNQSWDRLIYHAHQNYDLYAQYLQNLPTAIEHTLPYRAELEAAVRFDHSIGAIHWSSIKTLILAPALRLLDYQYFLKSYSNRGDHEVGTPDLPSMALSDLDGVIQSAFSSPQPSFGISKFPHVFEFPQTRNAFPSHKEPFNYGWEELYPHDTWGEFVHDGRARQIHGHETLLCLFENTEAPGNWALEVDSVTLRFATEEMRNMWSESILSQTKARIRTRVSRKPVGGM
ncbi:kinase-like protein [Mytilinidion resinicola]|uniref:Kinase-like protein n=1 Tax=Mytilinidion resinicola TaxID=574789 RepID=A0A6A6YF45_9PEZI|nr:kinase-like protein [Mytilinidion resinicola]KAF2807360.1 kinase-like protein [Mytilinidion resinicola]